MVAQLMKRDPDRLWLSRSWTTREQRPSETDQDYRFVTTEAFERRMADDGFLEWARVFDNYYGTPKDEAPEGRDLVLEIDVQGASQVAESDPDAVLVFIRAPSAEIQEQRLRGRGEDEPTIQKRLAKAQIEAEAGRELGAYEIVNDDLDHAVDMLVDLIETERTKRIGRQG